MLGKRVRMTGLVKSENVASWAGLWLRVDQSGSQQPLSFDNMGDSRIKKERPAGRSMKLFLTFQAMHHLLHTEHCWKGQKDKFGLTTYHLK